MCWLIYVEPFHWNQLHVREIIRPYVLCDLLPPTIYGENTTGSNTCPAGHVRQRFLCFQKNKTEKKEQKYLIRFLLISFFIATFVFAFGTIASGTAVRHRAKLIALLFVCYGLTRVYKAKVIKYENSLLQQ